MKRYAMIGLFSFFLFSSCLVSNEEDCHYNEGGGKYLNNDIGICMIFFQKNKTLLEACILQEFHADKKCNEKKGYTIRLM